MKVSLQEIQDANRKVIYQRIEGTTVTVCVLVLDNGFTAIGTSACVDPAEYNEALGQSIAYKNAESSAWAYLGFRLADKMRRAHELQDVQTERVG